MALSSMQFSKISSTSAQDGRMVSKTPRQRPYIPQYDRSTNEQDRFLDYCLRNKCLVTVILESGMALQGLVVQHDRKALLLGPLRSGKDVRIIWKSYIALVRAPEILPLFLEYRGLGTYLTRKANKRNLIKDAIEARKEAPRVQRKMRQQAKGAAASASPRVAGTDKAGTSVTIITKKRSRKVSEVSDTEQ